MVQSANDLHQCSVRLKVTNLVYELGCRSDHKNQLYGTLAKLGLATAVSAEEHALLLDLKLPRQGLSLLVSSTEQKWN